MERDAVSISIESYGAFDELVGYQDDPNYDRAKDDPSAPCSRSRARRPMSPPSGTAGAVGVRSEEVASRVVALPQGATAGSSRSACGR